MLNISRIIVGCFLMGFLYSGFDVNPVVSGLVIGILFGITGYAKERR
jgi:ABC-type sulfate transport system permease subunit